MNPVSTSVLDNIGSSGSVISYFRDNRRSVPRKAKVALIGNFAPRQCGIATFTTDIYEQLAAFRPELDVDVYALEDSDDTKPCHQAVATIVRDDPNSYCVAARRINESCADVVWLQHEYGIFGGEHGAMVCDFVDRLAAPLILTLHTVLSSPHPEQEAVLRYLISRASGIMAMSKHSRELLAEKYGAPAHILKVIEHGAPDRPFGRKDEFKQRLGLQDRTVLTTFGLLSPNKGLENVIKALPAIVSSHPDVLYRIVGATHPNLVRREGTAYRDSLLALAESLGVSSHIQWIDRFLETDELLDQLEACDIYITPYLNMQQSTSGTLSYAVALGKAVVSTPYVHARELLADNVGLLIQPESPEAVAEATNSLLANPEGLLAMQRRAYTRGRSTIWRLFANSASELIEGARAPESKEIPLTATPGLSGVYAMSDGTGIIQHAIGVVPDRTSGYCLDDNARALMLMNVATAATDAERMNWNITYASFLQSAWNESAGRFRNFMNFDRNWCEEVGSEDSNGRAFWALGHTVELSPYADLRGWALHWCDKTIATIASLASPRAIAFATLGATAVLRHDPDHSGMRKMVADNARILLQLLGRERRPDWAWFETVLGYDNPRLCQALIEAGQVLGDERAIAEGLETLDWIAQQQTSAGGQFRPIGSETFGKEKTYLPFDQQPLEAHAAIDAAAVAYRHTGADRYFQHALVAWRWFFGANDRGALLGDIATGRCRDGLTPRGPNLNCGAESILALQLSHYRMFSMHSYRRQLEAGVRVGPRLDT